MNGTLTLFVDQYGNKFYSKTLKELRKQIPGRISCMYVDGKDGKIYRAGYIVGRHWLTAYRPFETAIN